MQKNQGSKREDINRSNVFISWTGADEKLKSDISRYLKDKNLTVCESDAECAGNFLQWSIEAAVKSGIFLLVLTENLVNNKNSVARQEIKAWKALFKDGEDYANRTVVVCSDLALVGEFADENGVPYIAAADCLSCETFDNKNGITERNLQNIYNKTIKLIVGRMSRIYADKSASGRGIDITRLLGVDLLDIEKTKVDSDKIYIPRSLKFNDETYDSTKALADKTNKNVLFITAKAGSGKSCFIGQIINEYKNIDGAFVLTATCPDAAKYCIANVSKNEKYPVLLEYLFKKFIETCGIGESFYTVDNFASLIADKIENDNDLVIALDAIDEIALQDNTRAFVDYIEELQKFCENNVKIIVTDRGQTAAKMIEGACVCGLEEFNDDNVNEYCDKLFGLLKEKELTNKELGIDVCDLKDRIQYLKDDIKRNPFMLTQVVSLYALTGKINNSEIGMFDDITDVMFKSERLKFGKVTSANIVKILSEFAYYRQIKVGEGIIVTRDIAIEFFDELLNKGNGKTVESFTGEELTEYIVFRAFYSFKENKFFHESYGEYLTARYFCDKVFDECGNVVDRDKLDELMSRCGDTYWRLTINIFLEISGMKDVKIPDVVKNIVEEVFWGCSALKNIVLPNEMISIGEGAFRGCTSLESIRIPNGVTRIEKSLFSGCTSLKNISFSKDVTGIGEGAFEDCSLLENIIIPKGVNSIDKRMFSRCKSLKSIVIPDGVKHIGEMAFYGCDSLKNVSLSNNVTRIGEGAFAGCHALKSMIIPNPVRKIENSVFDDCSNLESIYLPEELIHIGKWAFSGCSSLKNIKIPNYVVYIGRSAFRSCSSLESIVIPKSVNYIDERVFRKCSLLGKVYFENKQGWVVKGKAVKEEDLEDPKTAAELLTYKYALFSWRRN